MLGYAVPPPAPARQTEAVRPSSDATSLREVQLPTRRTFLATAGAALAGAASRGPAPVRAQGPPLVLPPHVADVSGDGQVTPIDQEIVETALYASRGFDLVPRPSFDSRADVFGRGAIDAATVAAVSSSITRYATATARSLRPITVAWHYGWYKSARRPPGLQTARFRGGDYVSNDPAVEATFHDLKNEFGITVDALSWIPVRDPDNGVCQDNYRQGFLAAPNAATRHVCLLYESTIALPSVAYGRIDVQAPGVRALLREDFAAMARFLVEVRDATPSRIFRLDDRPVIFLFASHAWGVYPFPDGTFDFFAELRERFEDIYGVPPYLVGDELAFSPTGQFSRDRELRTVNLDAIYRYHHVAFKPGAGTTAMSQAYIENQIGVLRLANAVATRLRNRFTGRELLVIPNMAAGFAKPGYPTLEISRSLYADFLKRVRQAHIGDYLGQSWQQALGTSVLPAPVYVMGSWNEEFEGHTVFPFEFNLSVPHAVQHGFDLAMAIKEVFSWNHYAERDIAVDGSPGFGGTPTPGGGCLPHPCP